FLDPGLLHGRELAVRAREPFDRRDLLIRDRLERQLARLNRRTVQMHRAGAALADAAAVLRAYQAERVAKYPEQWRFRVDVVADFIGLPVDVEPIHCSLLSGARQKSCDGERESKVSANSRGRATVNPLSTLCFSGYSEARGRRQVWQRSLIPYASVPLQRACLFAPSEIEGAPAAATIAGTLGGGETNAVGPGAPPMR